MELSKKLLSELQNRLKVGNRRGVHLNAIPAKSRYKFDLSRLAYIEPDLPAQFIKALLTEQPLKFKISWKDSEADLQALFKEDRDQMVKIAKEFENLINQTETIESEKGINTFGFGFPILVRRDRLDNKLTVAPVLIWSLRIRRAKAFNTWEIHRNEDDPIYLNEVLVNHLMNDAQIQAEQIPKEMLDDGLIDAGELLAICTNLINAIHPGEPAEPEREMRAGLNQISPIKDKAQYERMSANLRRSFIEFGGLFSIFEVQKQNIIDDYDLLIDKNAVSLPLSDSQGYSFQPISSVETDPSQQSILHALESTSSILIQGPPGTGKSQTLTAVLINALENHHKTIVVCEKRTALEVLHQALLDKGLGSHTVLIRDVIKDRKIAVDSVRERIDQNGYRRYVHSYSKSKLNGIIRRASGLIKAINAKHQKVGQQMVDGKPWTGVVGSLLAELRESEEDASLNLPNSHFDYTPDELGRLLEIAQEGQFLYAAYCPMEHLSFLNPGQLTGENPYQLKRQIEEDFADYEGKLDELAARQADYAQQGFFRRVIAYFDHRKALQQRLHELMAKAASDAWFDWPPALQKLPKVADFLRDKISQQQAVFQDPVYVFADEFKWFSFYNRLSAKDQLLLDALKPKADWRRALLIHYLDAALVKMANADLPTNDHEHIELRDILAGIEKEQLKYIQNYWYATQIEAAKAFAQKNPDLSVENLYNKRSSAKFKRFSLRRIVQFDPDLFTTFFPIILTSPDVCCNLFKGMNQYFDLVMFDEASQLKLDDNLPALLKGKQIIIAGDEHQMPPSNYFSKVFDGAVEDEDELEDEDEIIVYKDNMLLSCESLLDFALELNFEKQHLDFHYRSKHPYLIDFSNHAFYEQRLKPLPNNFDYTPIKYIPVGGIFSEHTNEAEAEMVLEIIEKNIHRLPNGEYPSVGVATFNIAQRNLIKSKILERQRFERFQAFNDKIQELENNGMFVKNLENIQGDERDVIILSTTYGPSKEGKFAQRFGPINHSKGYKLLNVIITRAKYKVYVCCSIPEEMFLGYKEPLEAERANNRRAVFYAYLTYCKAVSELDDRARLAVLSELSKYASSASSIDAFRRDAEAVFEHEVYRALANELGAEKLSLMHQFAGFEIDILYDSGNRHAPRIAIECDGAKYHSSREAYLHDKHRQKILEGYGFVFHRIWSTNWWQDPAGERQRLLDFIRQVEKGEGYQPTDHSSTALAFTDVIEPLDYAAKISFPEDEAPAANRSALAIQVGSTVKLKYLNDGSLLRIQISTAPAASGTTIDGLMRIGPRSPLALSLLGHAPGQIVKVGDLDHYVEVVEVEG
jgi:very-short-patch-repair endonuclease/superoxide dismutase